MQNTIDAGNHFHYNTIIMMDSDDIIPIVLAILFAIALFFGLIFTIKKYFKNPPPPSKIDSKMEMKEQKWHMEDIRRRQKDLMRSQRDKIRDLRRR